MTGLHCTSTRAHVLCSGLHNPVAVLCGGEFPWSAGQTYAVPVSPRGAARQTGLTRLVAVSEITLVSLANSWNLAEPVNMDTVGLVLFTSAYNDCKLRVFSVRNDNNCTQKCWNRLPVIEDCWNHSLCKSSCRWQNVSEVQCTYLFP